MAMAVSTVLAIPELLESILGYVPAVDLLFARGVSEEWRTTVDSPPLLGMKLFTRSEPQSIAWVMKKGRTTGGQFYRPITTSSSIVAEIPISSPLLREPEFSAVVPVRLNPLLLHGSSRMFAENLDTSAPLGESPLVLLSKSKTRRLAYQTCEGHVPYATSLYEDQHDRQSPPLGGPGAERSAVSKACAKGTRVGQQIMGSKGVCSGEWPV